MANIRIALVTIPASIFSILKRLPGRDLLLIVEALVFLLAIGSCLGEGYYNGKWEAVSVGMVLILAYEINRKFGWLCSAMICYLMASTIWILDYGNRYLSIKPYDLLGLKFFTADSAGKLLLLVTPFIAVNFKRRNLVAYGRWLALAFIVISLSETAYEWALYGCGGINSCGGALNNPSMNASMLIACLPLAASIIGIWHWELFMLACITASSMLAKSSIGIGMSAIYLVALAWQYRSAMLLLLAPTVILIGRHTHGYKILFDSSGRFQMWKFFMNLWWKGSRNRLFGTGFGTFGIFSVNLQMDLNVNPSDWWIWMHNDWLQMLFECGIVGLALMLSLYLLCLHKLYKARGPEFYSFALFGIVMGCNYPLHVAPSCVYAAWIVAVALVKTETPSAIFRYQQSVNDSVVTNILLDKMRPKLPEAEHCSGFRSQRFES